MKILLMILALNFLPYLGDAQDQGTGPVSRFGISVKTFANVNRNDATAALKAWAATVSREQNLKEQVSIAMFDSFETLKRKFLDSELEAICITTEEYMDLNVRAESILLPSMESGYNVQYALIANNSSDIANLDSLRGHKIVTHGGPRMALSEYWLASVLNAGTKNRGLPNGQLIQTVNPSNAILQVFFHQAPAALTTLDAFELACELNPQLRKSLKVLALSQPFLTAFFIFRSTYVGPSRDRLEKAIMDLHTTPGGQQVLTIFQSSRMIKQPASALENTIQFLKEIRSQ